MDNIFNANIFDSSNINTVNDFISEIVPQLEEILLYRFPDNKLKQRIRIHTDNRIQFACPICGDSHNDSSKKRGNIILEPGKFQNMYKCHNCGAFMDINKFFKMFDKSLNLSLIDYIALNKHNYVANNDTSMNLLFDIEYIESLCIDKNELKHHLNLIDVDSNNLAGKYLISRNQYNFEKFLYDNLNNVLYVLNLTPNNKVIGLQTRNMNKSYNGPKYKTYKLSNIYSMLLHIEKDIPDDIDTLSMLFNVFLINFNKPIIVLEGPLDSFLVKNSTKVLTFLYQSLIIDMLTFYDCEVFPMAKDSAISLRVIQRLPRYYRFLYDLKENGICLGAE